MSQKIEAMVQSALFSTLLVQPVTIVSKGKNLNIVCRQLLGQEKPWLEVVAKLLKWAMTATVDIHICKRFILKEENLAYHWGIDIVFKETKTINFLVSSIIEEVLSKVKPVLIEKEVVQEKTIPQSIRAPKNYVTKMGHTKLALQTYTAEIDRQSTLFDPTPRIVRVAQENGIAFEMPLPHTLRELNIPKSGSTKGAFFIGKNFREKAI